MKQVQDLFCMKQVILYFNFTSMRTESIASSSLFPGKILRSSDTSKMLTKEGYWNNVRMFYSTAARQPPNSQWISFSFNGRIKQRKATDYLFTNRTKVKYTMASVITYSKIGSARLICKSTFLSEKNTIITLMSLSIHEVFCTFAPTDAKNQSERDVESWPIE